MVYRPFMIVTASLDLYAKTVFALRYLCALTPSFSVIFGGPSFFRRVSSSSMNANVGLASGFAIQHFSMRFFRSFCIARELGSAGRSP